MEVGGNSSAKDEPQGDSVLQGRLIDPAAGLFPELDEPRRVPLTHRELQRLYAVTDWRAVLLDGRIKESYQEYFTISLFKALALPFLIVIPSERALAIGIQERGPLQFVCGFLRGRAPTRPTLWHFRKKYSEAYPELMLQVLIALVLSGLEPNLALPFVAPVGQTARPASGHYSKFQLDVYRPPVEVWTTVMENETRQPILTAGTTWDELSSEVEKLEDRERPRSPRKKGLASGLGLPAEVRTELYGGRVVRFGIIRPEWIYSPGKARQADTLTTVGPATVRSYTACSVLVVRERAGRREVLLSRRLAGYGKGAYSLPGGKLRPDESVQECAARELFEETTLVIRQSRPVSLHITRLPGKPRVLSVSVLAECEGEPKLREPYENTGWSWFDLDSLPHPLFEPTRIAIDDYLNRTFPKLRWSDVEGHVSESAEKPRQLALPILDAAKESW